MCAIAGILNLQYNDAIGNKLLAMMARRGPDGSGVYTYEDCTLLHTRLAIIDPEGGKQPMSAQWQQETYTITYNGELYNTQEIRSELTQLGHNFTNWSDTEVVLHAYIQWGKECLHRINGIFAFAIFEQNNRRLFLARDRMGVKPLFFKHHMGGLLFASEIKMILAYPTVKAELDAKGAAEILLLGPGRIPGSGVFRGIYEIEPGCCGFYKNGKLQTERYWKLCDREHTDSFEQTVDTVRYLVTDAIKRQMVSDVPIGTFLSGGLDSSLISAVCTKEKTAYGEQLHTFSVDYKDNDKNFIPNKFQPNSDSSYIRLMREYLHSQHQSTVLTSEELIGALQSATTARDLPGMADVDFSLLLFCKDIRKHVKVALSGECADELFGGYPWYRDPEIRAAEGFPWAQNTAYRASFLHPAYLNEIHSTDFVMDQYRKTILESDVLPGTSSEERRMKEMVNLNYRWFMQTLLDRKDRMSMYQSLEVRVPFCDYRIAEYLYGVPWEMKDYQGREKGLLRVAMEGVLPQEVLWRKKSPYPKTWDPQYFELVSNCLRDLLQKPERPIFQLVSREALESLLTQEHIWPWYGQLMKLPQTIAYMLQIDYWLQAYKVSIL